jgi:hypothetical protein
LATAFQVFDRFLAILYPMNPSRGIRSFGDNREQIRIVAVILYEEYP